ncbi:hypothetical protein GF345_06345 [Candidatus Woesearchaeota archaeon]|nr:hypothetical protein [Candidatus Woesearchaeota archaeon]
MLDSMGYTGPNAVRNFQRDSGIGVDGIVGIQTSAALLKICSQNPGCDAESMTNYENKVGTNVESAATRAEESPGESAVRKHTPSERKGTDGVSIPNKPMEGDIKFECQSKNEDGVCIPETAKSYCDERWMAAANCPSAYVTNEGTERIKCNGKWITGEECPKDKEDSSDESEGNSEDASDDSDDEVNAEGAQDSESDTAPEEKSPEQTERDKNLDTWKDKGLDPENPETGITVGLEFFPPDKIKGMDDDGYLILERENKEMYHMPINWHQSTYSITDNTDSSKDTQGDDEDKTSESPE